MPALLSTAPGPLALSRMTIARRVPGLPVNATIASLAFPPSNFIFYQERIPGARPGSFATTVFSDCETYFEVG